MSPPGGRRDAAGDADELGPGEYLADVECGYVLEAWPPVAAPVVRAHSELVELVMRRRGAQCEESTTGARARAVLCPGPLFAPDTPRPGTGDVQGGDVVARTRRVHRAARARSAPCAEQLPLPFLPVGKTP